MQARDIAVLYEDAYLVLCEKPVGVFSQPDADGMSAGEDMISLLKEKWATSKNRETYVGLVHRLDCGVGGVMVFAKNAKAAGLLSDMVAKHRLGKEYLAVIHGKPEASEGEFFDLLYKDAHTNKSYVVDSKRRGVKEASLRYRVIATQDDGTGGEVSLVWVCLYTGRTHQIRVQFSHRGMPLVGDGKYGARDHGSPMGLWSYRLRFEHPMKAGVVIDEKKLPSAEPFLRFAEDLKKFDVTEE